MVRLLALLDKLDRDQVRRMGERARRGLEELAREHREIIKNVRGAGVMLGFESNAPTGAMGCSTARFVAGWCCCRPVNAPFASE